MLPPSERVLNTIGHRHGTDKGSPGHGYLDAYEHFFEPMRYQPLTLLEVGVYGGASVRMWGEYFPNARIIGVDIDPTALSHATDRITIELADQSNIHHLTDLALRHGPFDIFIDDASHIWDHQITSLHYMFPHVKPGGYYVVEDIHTSHGTIAAPYRGRSNISATEYLYRMCNYITGMKFMMEELVAEPDAFIRTYAPMIGLMTFVAGGSCVIQKKSG